MLKVINISQQTISLLLAGQSGNSTQYNLEPLDYVIVPSLTSQIKNLADPSREMLKIMKEEI